MYGALDRVGIRHAGAFTVNDEWLRAHAQDFDALHVHWPEWLWRPSGRSSIRWIAGLVRYLALARRLGLLRIWTVHNLLPHECQLPDVPGLWLVAREVDLFVCHSHDSERRVRQWLRPRASARTIVMPLGNYDGAMPPPAVTPDLRSRFGLPAKTALVGVVGQLRRYKGIETALDAIASLGDEAHLVIAGRPVGDMSWLLDRAAAMRSSVTVIDRALSDQELSDLVSLLDVVWLPYRRITGSSALLLALTAGVPTVASDLPFFREVLESAPAAGRLAPAGDGAAFARQTTELLAIPREDRRSAARSVAERYPWSACIRPLAGAIREALRERRLLAPEYA
jgi:glycosyltransferase involved in cell wall biosynthesis